MGKGDRLGSCKFIVMVVFVVVIAFFKVRVTGRGT